MSQPEVEIAGVSKRFGSTVALDQIDFSIQRGEFVSLLGPSGCGKSTLLRIIAGFESPSAGRVVVHGKDVTRTPPERRPTNIVFQRAALFPHMTVFENVAYSLELRRWPKARVAARVAEMLELVDLPHLGHRRPGELSGGQVQRVALVRALAAGPEVLLLDEPLSALDLKLRQRMQLELRAIQRKLGATFLYVTHDQTEALVMSDRIAVMNAGRIIQQGPPREIYTRPSSVVAAAFVGETNLLRGIVTTSHELVATLSVGFGNYVRAYSVLPLQPGARATISVRPEAVRIHNGGADSGLPDGIKASITEMVYLGDRIRVGAVTPDQAVVWADLRDEESASFRVGAPVVLSWNPLAANVWAEDSEMAGNPAGGKEI
jgi:spermidine/putrescine ABC transporter ATP-binding subunit